MRKRVVNNFQISSVAIRSMLWSFSDTGNTAKPAGLKRKIRSVIFGVLVLAACGTARKILRSSWKLDIEV